MVHAVEAREVVGVDVALTGRPPPGTGTRTGTGTKTRSSRTFGAVPLVEPEEGFESNRFPISLSSCTLQKMVLEMRRLGVKE